MILRRVENVDAKMEDGMEAGGCTCIKHPTSFLASVFLARNIAFDWSS